MQQLREAPARVEHAGLHGVARNADDVGDLLHRFLVVVDEVDDLPVLPRQAAEALAQDGVEAEVVDPRTLKPYDAETIITSVIKTGRVLIVNEGYRSCGYAAEISAVISEGPAFPYLNAPIRRLSGLDVPIPYNRTLEYHTVPQEENIVDAARELIRYG